MSYRSQTRRYDGRNRGRGGTDPFRDDWRRFASAWARALARLAPRPVAIESEGAHEDQFGAFAAALAGPRMIFVFRSQTLRAPGLLVLSPRVSELLIQLMHGGGPKASPTPRRETEAPCGLGASLLRRLAQHALEIMDGELFEGAALDVKLTRQAVGIEEAPITREDERVVCSRFRLDDGSASGVIDLLLPAAALTRLAEEKRRRLKAELNNGPGAASRETLTAALGAAFVELSVELGAAHLSLRDILALEPGHEIALAGDMRLFVEGLPKQLVIVVEARAGAPRKIRIS